MSAWSSLVEIVSLRRDAQLFFRLSLVLPSLGRSSTKASTSFDKAQCAYYARLFDDVAFRPIRATVGIRHRPDPGVVYLRNGALHRVDGPAVIMADGDYQWKMNNVLHREDGPAEETSDGLRHWCLHGKTHRVGGPAVELVRHGDYYHGYEGWYIHGEPHRIGGPARSDPHEGTFWYRYGKLHRINGPAVERRNGTDEWYWRGKLHRVDGPAVERADGSATWWFHGEQVDKSQLRLLLKRRGKKKLAK